MAFITGTTANDTITPGLISPGVSGFPTAGDDEIHGLEGADSIDGGAGNDVLVGDNFFTGIPGQWNDTLNGGSGADTMYGGDGNDRYIVENVGDDIDGEFADDFGVDTVVSSLNATALLNFSGGDRLENLILAANTVATSGEGNANNNVITGNSRPNLLIGHEGNDSLIGNGGNDILQGDEGNDTLRGGDGNDVLAGGFDQDIRIGGRGSDSFLFNTIFLPSTDILRQGDGGNAFDGIGNAAGDNIDVSLIDANATAGGNNAFIFGGNGKGHLSLVNSGSNTIVRLNVDNDAAFELTIAIEDGATQASAYRDVDFIL